MSPGLLPWILVGNPILTLLCNKMQTQNLVLRVLTQDYSTPPIPKLWSGVRPWKANHDPEPGLITPRGGELKTTNDASWGGGGEQNLMIWTDSNQIINKNDYGENVRPYIRSGNPDPIFLTRSQIYLFSNGYWMGI